MAIAPDIITIVGAEGKLPINLSAARPIGEPISATGIPDVSTKSSEEADAQKIASFDAMKKASDGSATAALGEKPISAFTTPNSTAEPTTATSLQDALKGVTSEVGAEPIQTGALAEQEKANFAGVIENGKIKFHDPDQQKAWEEHNLGITDKPAGNTPISGVPVEEQIESAKAAGSATPIDSSEPAKLPETAKEIYDKYKKEIDDGKIQYAKIGDLRVLPSSAYDENDPRKPALIALNEKWGAIKIPVSEGTRTLIEKIIHDKIDSLPGEQDEKIDAYYKDFPSEQKLKEGIFESANEELMFLFFDGRMFRPLAAEAVSKENLNIVDTAIKQGTIYSKGLAK